MSGQETRHILSLSGGKDSAALAIYMRDRVSEMEYIFHDTDKELPETYQYLARLEAILGKRIHHTTSEKSFDHWLTVYGGMIPSSHRRWCTRMMKLRPFERARPALTNENVEAFAPCFKCRSETACGSTANAKFHACFHA